MSRKHHIETLPHLQPILWGGFSPKQHGGYSYESLYRIVAGYTHRLTMMTGAHLYPFFVADGDEQMEHNKHIHAHFIISSDKDIESEKYRAARHGGYGWFFVKLYNKDLNGIDYMFSRHEELRFKEIFCRKGRNCRAKHKHREFHSALDSMYTLLDD